MRFGARRVRPLRRDHDRHLDRRGQRGARQLHAARRRGAAREHDARRGSPGGVGAGLYGMLVFALLAVFIAGLMVGRTPEYLGKKIQAAEMKLVVLYLLSCPTLVLALRGGLGRARHAQGVDPQPRPARALRDRLRVHVGVEQQRLGVRRPDREHRLVQHDARRSRCSAAASC